MDTKKPSAGTIARLICLVLAAVNQVFLLKTGHSLLPIESGKLEPWITTGLTFRPVHGPTGKTTVGPKRPSRPTTPYT